jgi:hypothetical protein
MPRVGFEPTIPATKRPKTANLPYYPNIYFCTCIPKIPSLLMRVPSRLCA